MLIYWYIKLIGEMEDLILNINILLRDLLGNVSHVLYISTPVWLPVLSGIIFWRLWVDYRQFLFLSKKERILLEIKLPKEITKTPVAMELFLNTLFQTGGESTFIKRYWEGSVRPWFSLEIVSIEGQVKFFVWTDKFWKNLIESQIYSQYPDVEIYEVEDYSKFVECDLAKIGLWGCEFKLSKPDPYPIKTYVDYGLDKEGVKEEYKTDPITPLLEYLGSIGKGEQIWLQIMVRAHKGKKVRKGGMILEKTDWKEEGKSEVKKLLDQLKPEAEEGKFVLPRTATKGEQLVVSSIERSIAKHGLDCGIRGVYLAEKDKFNAINVMGLLGSFKQYNSNELNGFKVGFDTSFDYPWQDYKNIRVNRLKKRLFNDYVKRAYFHHVDKPSFVLNTEELATIYHFPGGVAQTPTFRRVPSKKAEPPANLPV